jgi:hypothetical protein
MITVEDVRIFLCDYAPKNRLLGTIEWESEQIEKAIEYTISAYNEHLPHIQEYPINDSSKFPYRSLLLLGVTSWLLKSAGLGRIRNQLQFSTGGVTINDQAMADIYLQLGQAMAQEFDIKTMGIKKAENVKRGFGHIGSEYQYTSSRYYRG